MSVRTNHVDSGNWMAQGWTREQAVISDHDRGILRALGTQLRELAEQPINDEKVKLWTAHNDLVETRPVLLFDAEFGWTELIPNLDCEGEMAQDWEMYLRKEIYSAQIVQDDKPVEAVLYLPYLSTDSGFGIHEERVGDQEEGKAYHWVGPWENMDEDEFEELEVSEFIKTPVIDVDYETSQYVFDLAKDVFDGILDVKFRPRWGWAPWLSLSYSNLRGMENMMIDFYDFPEKVHEIMRLFTDGYLAKYRFLEEHNLLPNNTGNCYVGSGGLGHTSQLHPVDGSVKLMESWGFNEAQETSEISPEMWKEFFLPYQAEIAGLFGLNCYGCCEGLHNRFEELKATLPRLRRVSVSQWADSVKMAEMLQSDYVYSYKCSPTDLAVPNIDEDYIRANLRRVVELTKRNNNRVEFIMKDNHTLAHTPKNVTDWVRIAREEIARVW